MFYFTDERTLKKVIALHPKIASFEFNPAEDQPKINYIVTIGGDGTILYAAKEFKRVVPPVITFQRGTVGFLCQFSLPEMENVFQKLINYHKKEIPLPF